MGKMCGEQFSQTHEHDRAANDSPHAHKRRLTPSENRQKPDGNRECPLHPTSPPVDPANRGTALHCWTDAGSRRFVVEELFAPNQFEAFDHLLDLGERRRDAHCGEIRQQAERALARRAVPSRHSQVCRCLAAVVPQLAKTTAALGVHRT